VTTLDPKLSGSSRATATKKTRTRKVAEYPWAPSIQKNTHEHHHHHLPRSIFWTVVPWVLSGSLLATILTALSLWHMGLIHGWFRKDVPKPQPIVAEVIAPPKPSQTLINVSVHPSLTIMTMEHKVIVKQVKVVEQPKPSPRQVKKMVREKKKPPPPLSRPKSALHTHGSEQCDEH
jgi:hypothetical protein